MLVVVRLVVFALGVIHYLREHLHELFRRAEGSGTIVAHYLGLSDLASNAVLNLAPAWQQSVGMPTSYSFYPHQTKGP